MTRREGELAGKCKQMPGVLVGAGGGWGRFNKRLAGG